MMQLEHAIRIKDVISNLIDQVSSRKHTVLLSKSMNGDTSYSIHLKTSEVVYVFKRGGSFFSDYDVWYDGVSLSVPTMDARRLYVTMQQVYKAQERVKMGNKIEKLEKLLLS